MENFVTDNEHSYETSSLRNYLDGEFLHLLINAGAPEAIFEELSIGCDEYCALRENIPPLPNGWWRATPGSSILNGYTDTQNKHQNMREKAVDMMKNIAEMWDVKPEEVFGSKVWH